MNEAAALPSPRVLLSRRLHAVLRPPPTPTRLAVHFPGSPGYRTRRSDNTPSRRPSGRGGPPQFPPPPSERSEPSTPGSSSGLQSRLFTASVAFAVKDAARLSLPPAQRRAH